MNYNKAGLVALLSCVLLSFVWFVWLIYGLKPVDLGEESPQASQNLPQKLSGKYWISRPILVQQGQQKYQTYCATCHGSAGMGDGPAGAGLKPRPRNLVEGQWTQGGSSIKLYETLSQGIQGTGMASFSYLSPGDRWALVHYIRSITKNKVKDDFKKLEEFAKIHTP